VSSADLDLEWPAAEKTPPIWDAMRQRRYLYRRGVHYGDSPAQVLDVYRRKDLPIQPAPVLIFVPGGAWVHGRSMGQGPVLMSKLVEQGWVCLAIDYRAAPHHRWPRHIIDVKTAIAWARANVDKFGGDRNFVAVAGCSAGGHLSALAGLTPNDPQYQAKLPKGADSSADAVVGIYGQRALLTRANTANTATGQVFTAVDLETTGLFPSADRIVEIGLVKFRGDGEILDEFATLVNNPGSSPEARMRHQIDDEDLIGSPTIDHVLPEVFAFMAGTVVVAHNLDFEEGFLLLAAQRNRLSLPRLTGVCTVQAARRQLDGRAYSLLSLYKTATGEWPHDKHTALGDARAVRKVLLWMLRTAPQPMHLTLGAIPVPATAVAVQPCAISCRPMPMTRASVAALLESFPQSPTHGAATRPRLTVTGVYSTNAFTTDDSPLRRPPHCPAKPGAPA
jgi:acetyl esterase/lipase